MYGNRRREGGGGGFRGGSGGGFRDRREGFDKPKPVKIGEEYDVKITEVGAKGDGITKIENFIVFVHGAKKGEECRIRIKEVANKFAIAEKVGSSDLSDEEEKKETDEKEEKGDKDESSEEDTEEAEDEDLQDEDEEEW